jgi:hypothetical protein
MALAAVQQQLAVLDKEVADLDGELGTARHAGLESRDALKKQVYDDVKEELAQLNQMQSQLAGVCVWVAWLMWKALIKCASCKPHNHQWKAASGVRHAALLSQNHTKEGTRG